MRTMETALCLLVLPCLALGDTWFVNNRSGDDGRGGRTAATAFATIAKATAWARTSDTIALADTGLAYREPIRLHRLGGTPAQPFVVEGNGAAITGLQALPAKAWQRRDDGSYFHPVPRKPYGVPFLVERRRRLPAAKSAEAVEPGQFFWGDDGVLFCPEEGKAVGDYALEATLIVSGLEIAGSSYITCRNLVSEFHSNDGFNVHGDCRGIVCESIVGRHNGDDGFSVHETIGTVVRNAHFHHNRWGIQDVNASRSIFNGVTAEHNEANGVHFVGGYHSLVDSIVRDNGRAQVAVTGERPKHLVGSEHNPLCRGIAFLQNVVATGGTGGLSASNGAQVTAWNCVFARSGTGVLVNRDSTCHLVMSVVSDCAKHELVSRSTAFFRDHNLYHPGRFRWLDTDYGPEQWAAFRAAAGHDERSQIAHPRLSRETGEPLSDSPALKMKRRPGPTAPVRGYVGAVGDWSNTVQGLRCRLSARQANVPLGAKLMLDLGFRFDPRGTDPKLNVLSCFKTWRRVKLRLTDLETGRVHTRSPDDPTMGMLLIPFPRDYVLMRDGPIPRQRLSLSLLARDGQQFPPGRYSVAALYHNDGEPRLQFPPTDDGSLISEPYKGPWAFWKGILLAPPVIIQVNDVGPGLVELKTNSALVVKDTENGIGYTWSEAAPLVLRVRRRPGYVLGRRHTLHVLVNGRDLGEKASGLGSGCWRDAKGMSYLHGIAREPGQRVTLRADVEIFETSIPPEHMWMPQAGDYKVLWKGTIEGTLAPPRRKAQP